MTSPRTTHRTDSPHLVPLRFGRGNRSLVSTVKRFVDPLAVQLALVSVFWLFGEPLHGTVVLLALGTFLLTFPGSLPFRSRTFQLLGNILTRWALTVSLILAAGYLSDSLDRIAPDAFVTWLFVAPLTVWGVHLVSPWLVPLVFKHNRRRRAAVVGANAVGTRLIRTINAQSNDTLIEAIFDDRTPDRWDDQPALTYAGGLADVAEYVRHNDISLLYIALPMASQPRIASLLSDLSDTTWSIYFVPDVFVFDLIQALIDVVGETPVLAVCESPFHGVQGLLKRWSDVVVATIAVILTSPVMLAIALAIRLESRGPILFRQRRHGLDGQEIVVWKFRTMNVSEDGPVVQQASADDPRVTRIGRFLRRTSLDELPQFLNVLTGDMSVVGPRPHALAHNSQYRQQIRGYMIRHKVKPGITGWAQINGARGETDTVEKMQRRIELDMYYLRHWSLGLDLLIIARTALQVLRDPNAY